MAGVKAFGHVPRPRESVRWTQFTCDVTLRTATGSPHPLMLHGLFEPWSKNKKKLRKRNTYKVSSWLSIRNDCRTLIEADELNLLENDDDDSNS